MLCSDTARCLLAIVFTIFAAAHVTSLAELGPVAALLGAGAALFMPASYAILPTLLTSRDLQAGNALYNAAVQGGTLLGPHSAGPSSRRARLRRSASTLSPMPCQRCRWP